MATRAQKIRLAVFFLVSGSVLALLLLAVAGSHLLKKREFYTVEFTDIPVGGLNEGAAVKYQGVTVGRVEQIYISDKDIATVVVGISVEPEKVGQAIKTDTQATIYNLGITGLKYIELIGGSREAPVLPSGSRIEASQTFLSNLEERADVISNKIEQLLDRTNLLLDENNREQFTLLLANSGELMSTLNDLVQQNHHSLSQTAQNLALMSQSLASTTATMETTMDSLHNLLTGQRLQSTVSDLQLTTRRLRQQMDGPVPRLIARLDTMVTNVDKTFVGIDQTMSASRENVLNAMRDLEETLLNIRETSEIIRDNPSVLIRGGGRSGATSE